MDRQTLRDWVHRYNAQGVAGPRDRKAPAAKPKLSEEQEAEAASWVRSGPDLAEDGVVLAERSGGGLLRRLGFRRLSVRPQHPQQDAEALEAHKKTLPPYCPELNPIENNWQFLRQNRLSHRVFDSYGAIVEACCEAWNALAQAPDIIRSIASPPWAEVDV
jgi:Transposase and inactivated derivatives